MPLGPPLTPPVGGEQNVCMPLGPPLTPPVGGEQNVFMPMCGNRPPPTGGDRGGHFGLNFTDHLAIHGGGKL